LENDLDLKMIDLQPLERSLHHVIVSRIRNILMPVGSLYDDWDRSGPDLDSFSHDHNYNKMPYIYHSSYWLLLN
jgi:hypothetical protein